MSAATTPHVDHTSYFRTTFDQGGILPPNFRLELGVCSVCWRQDHPDYPIICDIGCGWSGRAQDNEYRSSSVGRQARAVLAPFPCRSLQRNPRSLAERTLVQSMRIGTAATGSLADGLATIPVSSVTPLRQRLTTDIDPYSGGRWINLEAVGGILALMGHSC